MSRSPFTSYGAGEISNSEGGSSIFIPTLSHVSSLFTCLTFLLKGRPMILRLRPFGDLE